MDQLIERRYWASRPDRHNPEVFADELRKGRLRQGWGYSDECNLEAIRQKYWDDAKGWQGLPDELHAVIQNYPFDPNWPTGQATMRAGDIVLVPNIPKWGFFSLVEIQDDEYQFEPIQLNEKQKDRDYNLEQDYGHYRKVKLLTPEGISKQNENVTADLQITLQCRSRIWRLDRHRIVLDRLAELASVKISDLLTSTNDEARLAGMVVDIQAEVRKIVLEKASDALSSRFKSKTFEFPVRKLLKHLFPEAEVDAVGGRSEVNHGTDILVSIPNPLSKSDKWLLPVQVKDHEGQEDVWVIDQLGKALTGFGDEKDVIGLVLITTAKGLTEKAETRRKEIERDHNVHLQVIAHDELMELFSDFILRSSGNALSE